MLSYAGKFAALVFFFSVLALTPAYQSLVAREVAWSAEVAHGVLTLVAGGASAVAGATLFRGPEAILEVKSSCSGLSYCWLFCSAVLAFPAGLGLRLAGALLGTLILMGMNILRIGCLFLIGCYYPGMFAAAHEQFWPVFSLATMAVLLAGCLLCVRKSAKGKA